MVKKLYFFLDVMEKTSLYILFKLLKQLLPSIFHASYSKTFFYRFSSCRCFPPIHSPSGNVVYFFYLPPLVSPWGLELWACSFSDFWYVPRPSWSTWSFWAPAWPGASLWRLGLWWRSRTWTTWSGHSLGTPSARWASGASRSRETSSDCGWTAAREEWEVQKYIVGILGFSREFSGNLFYYFVKSSDFAIWQLLTRIIERRGIFFTKYKISGKRKHVGKISRKSDDWDGCTSLKLNESLELNLTHEIVRTKEKSW